MPSRTELRTPILMIIRQRPKSKQSIVWANCQSQSEQAVMSSVPRPCVVSRDSLSANRHCRPFDWPQCWGQGANCTGELWLTATIERNCIQSNATT